MPVADLSTERPITAALLLDEWEHGRPAGAARVGSAVCDAFAAFVAEALASDADVNVDEADIRRVLEGATGLGIGWGGGSGPHRAQLALADAWRRWQAVDWYPTGEGRLLLAIRSHVDHDLDMDDLTAISEALQQVVGPGWEWVSGHGVAPNQVEEMCLGFLLAPRAQPEAIGQPTTSARKGS